MTRFLSRRLCAQTTIVGSMLMASCAVVPESTDLPVASRHAPTEVLEPFVPRGAPVDASTAERLTLEQLLVYADVYAPSVRVARARVGLADAQVMGAEVVFPSNPQVSFGLGGRSTSTGTGFEFEAAIQQQLEVAGEQGARLQAARDGKRLRRALVNEVRWNTHVEVHRLFVSLLLVRERVAQAQRFVSFATSMRQIAQRQIEAGESSPLILLVADSDLAQTRAALVTAQQVGQALEARLAAVVGWPDTPLSPLEGTLPEVREAPETRALLELMAQRHPSLRTREIAVAASRSRLELEERDAQPEPSVGFSYTREASPGPGTPEHIWMLNLNVPIPIWRTNQEGRARAEAQLLVADRERDANATRLRGELIQAALRLNAAAERVALYKTGVVEQLEKNLVLLERAYELGEVDIHQVSQTRERLLTATGQHIDSRITYYETTATLEGLVGAEIWSTEEDTP